MPSRGLVWLAILVGSSIGALVPTLWGADVVSYAALVGSTVGALLALWLVYSLTA